MFRDESEFVRWLQTHAPRGDPRLKLGIGDDAALVEVRRGHELILTTDMSIEEVHFSPRLHAPRSVGHRALARSLSDIAAMGGTPRYALVSLALSRSAPRAWVDAFYKGLLALAQAFKVSLIGGDTAVVPGPTMIDVLVAGEVPRGSALRRSGARPGELLYVSGRLGWSALGLRLLKSQPPGRTLSHVASVCTLGTSRLLLTEAACAAAAIQAHLYPQPQCALGRYLAARRLTTAMIDLSDGLSTDLNRLCEASGVGARVWTERLPHPYLEDPHDSLQLALDGGEDYQLLFTVDPRQASRLPARFRGIPLRHIGEITRAKKVVLHQATGREETLQPRGYDHFRKCKENES
jgi:thiamine-monophosphate kinase